MFFVENLVESRMNHQFALQKDFIWNFDVTINLFNAMLRICNPERKYVTKPINLITTFFSRRVGLKANEVAILSLRMKKRSQNK